MSALKTLVAKYLSKNNLSRSQLARNLGYSNISKGLRNIDQYCLTLLDKNSLSSKLPIALHIPENEFSKVVSEVQCHIENNERLKFKPSVQVILSVRPSPLFLAGLFPALWHVEIPDIGRCNFDQELLVIFNAYKNHQLQVNTEAYDGNNYLEYIREIEKMDKENIEYRWTVGSGFRYFRQFDETVVFNRGGEIVRHVKHHIEPIKASVSVSGKNIPPSLMS